MIWGAAQPEIITVTVASKLSELSTLRRTHSTYAHHYTARWPSNQKSEPILIHLYYVSVIQDLLERVPLDGAVKPDPKIPL